MLFSILCSGFWHKLSNADADLINHMCIMKGAFDTYVQIVFVDCDQLRACKYISSY